MLELVLGITGMALILFVFILDEFESKYNQKTLINNLFSILGAGLLIFYALSLKAWPFVVLNFIWLAVAGIKIVKILKTGA
ncbi:MAG: hypothetical protein ABIA37_01545 [Candidatus Woesearchaeota archaeon]